MDVAEHEFSNSDLARHWRRDQYALVGLKKPSAEIIIPPGFQLQMEQFPIDARYEAGRVNRPGSLPGLHCCAPSSSTGVKVLDEQAIYAQLTTIFQDVFDDDDIVLHPDMTADDVAGWDSMSHVRLILTIERHYQRRFPASQISQLNNVGDLVRLIEAAV